MNNTVDRNETREADDLLSLLNEDEELDLGSVGKPKRNNVWLRPLINLLVIALLSVTGYALYAKYFKTDAVGPKQYKIIAAATGKVKKTIAASGTLQPWSTVDIKSKAGGRVDALLVNVGNEVKAGQILARIDPSDSLLTYKQSEADVASAQARIDQGGFQYELQKKQSALAIQNAKVQLFSAQANLRAAQARLETGKTQETAQPALTRAAIANAQASYDQSVQSRAQLDATDPQSRASAKATYDQAVANRDNAKQSLERQISLAKQGFVSQQTVDTAQATLAVNESQVSSSAERLKNIEGELRASVQSAEARVAQAKASLEQAKTQSMDVTNKRNSTKELEAAVVQAQASVEQAQVSLSEAIANQANIGIKQKDITSSQATMARSEASFNNAKTTLDQTTVRAPSAGVVLKKYVEQGTIITSGLSLNAAGTSIVQLGDISRMYIDVTVDETDIANVEEDQTVEVTVDAYPNVPFEGKVARIDPQATVEQNVTTVHVRVEVDNASPTFKLIKPGMNASCEFVLGRKENVVTVPNDAVREDTQGKYIEVPQGGKPAPAAEGAKPDPALKIEVTPKRVPVEVGLVGNDTTEIVSGLKEGDQIIGQTIEPEAPDAPGAASGGGFGPPGMGRR